MCVTRTYKYARLVERFNTSPSQGEDYGFEPRSGYHLRTLGLIQVSNPLGIKFPYKNSVVTNRLIPECATLFHLASRLCRYHYRRYRFSFVYGHQLSQPYER